MVLPDSPEPGWGERGWQSGACGLTEQEDLAIGFELLVVLLEDAVYLVGALLASAVWLGDAAAHGVWKGEWVMGLPDSQLATHTL